MMMEKKKRGLYLVRRNGPMNAPIENCKTSRKSLSSSHSILAKHNLFDIIFYF